MEFVRVDLAGNMEKNFFEKKNIFKLNDYNGKKLSTYAICASYLASYILYMLTSLFGK